MSAEKANVEIIISFSRMKTYQEEYESLVFKAISDNFSEFKALYEGQMKLQFIKLMKDNVITSRGFSLGLKECKEFTDYFFDNPVKFYALDVIGQRKEKLTKIYYRELLDSFIDDIKDIDSSKLKKAFLELPPDTLAILMKELGYIDDDL